MPAYYNELDPAAAHILRTLIDADVIAPGIVDTRSIKEVQPDDLNGFTQCHFFAGGGLWSVAARLAGWPDDEPLWTGSCPCQPFSAAGKGGGEDDPRHLWPDLHRLIRARRPAVVMGEQVAGAAGYGWFDGVRTDLASEGYASRSVDFPACSVDAPHQRNRQYWVAMEHAARIGWGEGQPQSEVLGGWTTAAGADASGVTLGDAFGKGLERQPRHGDSFRRSEQDRPIAAADGSRAPGDVALADGMRDRHPSQSRDDVEDRSHPQGQSRTEHRTAVSRRHNAGHGRNGTHWSDAEWIICHDGKARRAKPGIRLLAHGVSGRVDLWRVGGNAIVPQAAAEVIGAFIDVYGLPSEWSIAA